MANFQVYPTNLANPGRIGTIRMTLNIIFVLIIITHTRGFESIKIFGGEGDLAAPYSISTPGKVRQASLPAGVSRGGDWRGRPVRLPAALAASHRLRVHRRGALRQPLVTQLQTLLPQTLQGEPELKSFIKLTKNNLSRSSGTSWAWRPSWG